MQVLCTWCLTAAAPCLSPVLDAFGQQPAAPPSSEEPAAGKQPSEVISCELQCLAGRSFGHGHALAVAILRSNRNFNRSTLLIYSGTSDDPAYVIHGDHTDERFGARLKSIGDIDGDQVDDLLVCAPSSARPSQVGPSNSGRVIVLSGENGRVLQEYKGLAGESLFGNDAEPLLIKDGRQVIAIARGRPSDSIVTVYGVKKPQDIWSIKWPSDVKDTAAICLAGIGELAGDQPQTRTLALGIRQSFPSKKGRSFAAGYSVLSSEHELEWTYDGLAHPGLDGLGDRIMSIPDCGGDKVEEVLVTASGIAGFTAEPDYAVVLDGRTGKSKTVYRDQITESLTSIRCALIEDQDDDGLPDIALGEYGETGIRDHVSVYSAKSKEPLWQSFRDTNEVTRNFGSALAKWIDEDGDGKAECAVAVFRPSADRYVVQVVGKQRSVVRELIINDIE